VNHGSRRPAIVRPHAGQRPAEAHTLLIVGPITHEKFTKKIVRYLIVLNS